MKMRSWSESSGRHAGAFDFYRLVQEDDDDQGEADGDKQVAGPDANLVAQGMRREDRSVLALASGCPLLVFAVVWVTTEDNAGTWVSGEVGVASCFSSVLFHFSVPLYL